MPDNVFVSENSSKIWLTNSTDDLQGPVVHLAQTQCASGANAIFATSVR